MKDKAGQTALSGLTPARLRSSLPVRGVKTGSCCFGLRRVTSDPSVLFVLAGNFLSFPSKPTCRDSQRTNRLQQVAFTPSNKDVN